MSASTIRRANSSFVLSGLVFCTCGSPLNGRVVKFKNTNGYQYYACCKDSPDECQAKKIPKDVLESAVIESVVKYILSPECLAALQADQVYEYQHRSAENQARRSELVAQLRSVRAAITNITSAIAGIGYSKALLTKLAEMEKREIEITNQIAELDAWLSTPPEQLTPDNLKQYSGALHSALTSADVKIQREILTAFISKITVERDGKTITGLISYYQPPTDLLRSNSDPDPPNNDIYAYISTPLRGARCRAP
jgi:site-specific DNA recombinase